MVFFGILLSCSSNLAPEESNDPNEIGHCCSKPGGKQISAGTSACGYGWPSNSP